MNTSSAFREKRRLRAAPQPVIAASLMVTAQRSGEVRVLGDETYAVRADPEPDAPAGANDPASV